ncbi:MAG: phospholipid carrier-dependent glycosyltransferase [Blastocatellia bacterium]|nr:phospholipid carrier-dependent glycosyltransferase [Blastocatellia bacterium]
MSGLGHCQMGAAANRTASAETGQVWKQTLLGLVLLTIVALGLRVTDLGSAGLAEDEAHKIEAVAAYRHGDFTPNAEHPMLMKLAMTASLMTSEQWNSLVPAYPVAPEAALRFPNALLGALTTLVLGWLAAELFSPLVGLVTGAVWATGMLSIAINRIGKEDTFLVFFLWLAYATYFHAKKLGSTPPTQEKSRRQAWWYTASGASFGLMLASKYFPHYWGLLFLWEYVDHKLRPANPLTNPIPRFVFPRFYGAMIGCFLLANPVVWLPSTISYMVNYVGEETVTHHGYLLLDQLYFNNPSRTVFSGGLPLWFYPLMVGVKTVPTILLGLLVGLAVAIRNVNRDSRFFMLLFLLVFWLVPFSIIGGKWMRYLLAVLPVMSMLAAVGIAWLAEWVAGWGESGKETASEPDCPAGWARWLPVASQGELCRLRRAAVCAAFLLPTLLIGLHQAPHYSLYINSLGGGEAQAGTYFPHDEFYDAGVREALTYLAQTAPPQATVISETPCVVNYYLKRLVRPDLATAVLSDPQVQLAVPGVKFVLVQKGRFYFENMARLEQVRKDGKLCQEIRVGGKVAVAIYRLDNGKQTPNLLMVSTQTAHR